MLQALTPVFPFTQLGIYAELGKPKDLVIITFDVSRIQSIRQGALVTFVLILATIVVKVASEFLKARNFCARRELAAQEPLLSTE